MDGGAWWAAVHGVARSQTQLSDFTFTFHFHALERELATHSSVLAWRIPGTGEPGGLLSMGSHRVGHAEVTWQQQQQQQQSPKLLCCPRLLCRHLCHLAAPPPGLPSHSSGPSRNLSFHHSLVPLLTGPSLPQAASSVLKTESARPSLALDCLAQAGPSSPSLLPAGSSHHLSFRCPSLPPRWLYFMGYLPIQPKPTAASCSSCTVPLFEDRHGLPPASSFKHRGCG